MVKVDNVYQKVLALANKEQRGYITPQEFNLFADHAQMEIFEQYFYDVDQFERRMGDDTAALIKRKIEVFKSSSTPIQNYMTLPTDVYMVETVYLNIFDGTGANIGQSVAEKTDRDGPHNLFAAIENSPLTKSSIARPIYAIYKNKFSLYPKPDPPNNSYQMNYIRTPRNPNWTYLINPSNQSALYNPTSGDHQDFELHASEESKLVIKILQLAGVNMKDYNLAQLAGQKEASVKQQEKQ